MSPHSEGASVTPPTLTPAGTVSACSGGARLLLPLPGSPSHAVGKEKSGKLIDLKGRNKTACWQVARIVYTENPKRP